MPPFRFKLPFFSYGSPSRLSSPTSSPSPPPPPPSSRPPFRPAGIAQPSKTETKSKVPPPSLSRSKSNVKSISASSTPTRLAKQSNQSGSPLKKPESMSVDEKPLKETEYEARETIDSVTEKADQGQRKKTEVEKLAAKVMNSDTAHEQLVRKETEKLAVEEKKKVLFKDMEEYSDKIHEQLVRKETEKLAVEEKKKVLGKDTEENSKTAQEQHKTKETEKQLASQERNRALHTMTREDTTQSKTKAHIASTSESKGPIDTPARKTHTDDNHQKVKTESTTNHENPRVVNGEGSSSMSRKIKEDIRNGISKLTCGKSNNNDDKSVSVYTLTGENRGATMGIASDKDKKDNEVHIRRGYKSNPDESPNTTSTETEGNTKPFEGENLKEEARVRAYANGNTQAINNSIVLESSVRENNPGIHMIIKLEERKKKKDDETRVRVYPRENEAEKKPEKLKYETRVRRRCLRGLLAETSESDPENPLKRRRHGCRFTCKDNDIENT
ncbi:unnamed protein product [Cochlearia groenlandica]